MARPFTTGKLARRRAKRQFEGLPAQFVHGHAIQVSPRVHVHFSGEHFESLRGRYDLDRRYEREIRDGTVPGHEKDEVAARRHLSRDTFQVITGAVHEIVTGVLHADAVVYGVVEAHVRMALVRRADGLEHDVVDAPELVPARRVGVYRLSMPCRAFLEPFDHAQEGTGRIDIPDILQHVGFAADEFVRFRQIRLAAETDDVTSHQSGQGIS